MEEDAPSRPVSRTASSCAGAGASRRRSSGGGAAPTRPSAAPTRPHHARATPTPTRHAVPFHSPSSLQRTNLGNIRIYLSKSIGTNSNSFTLRSKVSCLRRPRHQVFYISSVILHLMKGRRYTMCIPISVKPLILLITILC